MLHLCDQCPGNEIFRKKLEQIFEANVFDLKDIIAVKQWMHTDRTKLMDLQLPVNEFIETICEKFHALRQHYFQNAVQGFRW